MLQAFKVKLNYSKHAMCFIYLFIYMVCKFKVSINSHTKIFNIINIIQLGLSHHLTCVTSIILAMFITHWYNFTFVDIYFN